MATIRRAIPEDGFYLSSRLRKDDLREIKATSGEDPAFVMENGIKDSSPCYSVVDDNGLAFAVFGVVPDFHSKGQGIVWLLGSDEIRKHYFFFLRNSVKWVEKLQSQYKVLWNYVDARNELHIKWIKWCGFTLSGTTEKYGIEKRAFYEIIRTRE